MINYQRDVEDFSKTVTGINKDWRWQYLVLNEYKEILNAHNSSHTGICDCIHKLMDLQEEIEKAKLIE